METPPPVIIPGIGTGVQTLLLPGTGTLAGLTRTVVVSANNQITSIIANTEPGTNSVGQIIPASSNPATRFPPSAASTLTSSASPSNPYSTASTSPSSSTSTLQSSSSSGSPVNIGAIIGGVIGGVAVVGVIGVAIFWISRKHPRTKPTGDALPATSVFDPTTYPEVAYAQNGSQQGYAPQELEARWHPNVELPAAEK